ncbi:MAG: GNAT family N-acetyltransferase [Acetobacteraceae bacterium]|nr:GNAT family N-acetyltransferase [Acetobacteraceae bacterium]
MPSITRPTLGVRSAILPALPDGVLSLAAPVARDLWASALWYETTLLHALSPHDEPVWLPAGAAVIPLLRRDGRLSALTTPYTQAWRPLGPPKATEADWRDAGRALAGALRLRPPARLDTIEAESSWLAPFLAGVRAGGVVAARFAHTGRWVARSDPSAGWEGYLAARPAVLRNTVLRRLKAARRSTRFDLVTAPGEELERAIDAFRAVRSRSWKPAEPFPEFDPALMRAAAEAGLLRLGVLRETADGTPLAAQYWLLQPEAGRALMPKLFHDESRRAASPGTVLTALMVRHLIEQDRVRVLDFGRGDDAYKALWAPERVPLVGFLLADPRHPVGAAALLRHAAGAALRRLRRLR